MAVNDEKKAQFERKRKLKNQLSRSKTGDEQQSWRKVKEAKKGQREENLLKKAAEVAEKKSSKAKKDVASTSLAKPYSITIAVPGSILVNAQSPELRTLLDSYWSGKWRGDLYPSEIEANFHLARILEYLECPQYLRKALFPMQKPLKYAGLLNPLDSQHHLKFDDLSIPFREGIILDKPVKAGRGPLCEVGLDKRYRGVLSSARKVRAQTGFYWGYSVRLAKSIGELLDKSNYDTIIGTSLNGFPVDEMKIPSLGNPRVLLVFGGLQGVEAAVEADESLPAATAAEAFDMVVNPVPGMGARTARVEELIPLMLLAARLQLESR